MANVYKNDEKINVLFESINELKSCITEKNDEISSKISELNNLLSAVGLSVDSSLVNNNFENLETNLNKINESINSDNSLINDYSEDEKNDSFETIEDNKETKDKDKATTETENTTDTDTSNSKYNGGYSNNNGNYTNYNSSNSYTQYKEVSALVSNEVLTSGIVASEISENNDETENITNTTSQSEVTSSVVLGNYDINNYPTGNTEEEGLIRAALVAKYLASTGEFTLEQAAGLAGVFLDENMCNPSAICYDGGMGIQSWTGSVKTYAMQSYGTSEQICNLSLKEQCDMIRATAQPGEFLSTYYNALKRCETVEDAAATAIVLTGGVGYSKNWSTHPTLQDAQNCLNVYIRYNGSSSYTLGAFERRITNGQKILNLINNS